MSQATRELVGPRARAARPAGQQNKSLAQALIGWGFAAPWLAIFLVVTALPIVASFLISFTDFSLGDLVAPLGAPFVGLSNYAKLFSDDTFLASARNTFFYVVVGGTLTLALGLAAAVGLNRGITRFRAFFRVGYYTPVVTSIVAIAVVWRFLLDPDYGLINGLLHDIGVSGPNWLGDTRTALPAIILMIVWRNLGNAMIIFLAGLQGISFDMYEAARIDGANRWQEFLHVTWPLLRPTTLFLAVITTIGYLQVFEEPFVMTQGGPLNATITPGIYIYKEAFNYFHLGYASAVAYTLFLVIVAVTIIQFRLLRTET